MPPTFRGLKVANGDEEDDLPAGFEDADKGAQFVAEEGSFAAAPVGAITGSTPACA